MSEARPQELVPLADRLRYLQLLRVAMVAPILLMAALAPDRAPQRLLLTVILSAAYLLVALPTVRSWQLERASAVAVFSGSLLLDGLFLAVTTYGSGGLASPLRYLLLVHVMSVTLLASFRTGLKIALWHSLLLGAAYQLQESGSVHVPAKPQLFDLVVIIGSIWLVTIATASFGAVNERELRRRNFDLRTLSAYAIKLESVNTPKGVAEAFIDAVVDTAGCRRVVLSASPTGQLVPLAGRAVAPVEATVRPDADQVAGEAMRTRRTVRVTSVDPTLDPWLATALPDAVNLVVVPLFSEAGPLGVLVFEYGPARSTRIERRIVEVVEQLASQTGLALQNAWLFAQVRALAATDGLTGLVNRRTFDTALAAEISRAQRSGAPFALILVDVDHFKAHNDTYGHQAGDRSLRRVAAALRNGARLSDTVARYGGEEFVLLTPGCDAVNAYKNAERLRTLIEALPDEPHVTVSMGVACYPQNSLDGAGLLRAADAALYLSKDNGRNKVTVAWPAARPELTASAG